MTKLTHVSCFCFQRVLHNSTNKHDVDMCSLAENYRRFRDYLCIHGYITLCDEIASCCDRRKTIVVNWTVRNVTCEKQHFVFSQTRCRM